MQLCLPLRSTRNDRMRTAKLAFDWPSKAQGSFSTLNILLILVTLAVFTTSSNNRSSITPFWWSSSKSLRSCMWSEPKFTTHLRFFWMVSLSRFSWFFTDWLVANPLFRRSSVLQTDSETLSTFPTCWCESGLMHLSMNSLMHQTFKVSTDFYQRVGQCRTHVLLWSKDSKTIQILLYVDTTFRAVILKWNKLERELMLILVVLQTNEDFGIQCRCCSVPTILRGVAICTAAKSGIVRGSSEMSIVFSHQFYF